MFLFKPQSMAFKLHRANKIRIIAIKICSNVNQLYKNHGNHVLQSKLFHLSLLLVLLSKNWWESFNLNWFHMVFVATYKYLRLDKSGLFFVFSFYSHFDINIFSFSFVKICVDFFSFIILLYGMFHMFSVQCMCFMILWNLWIENGFIFANKNDG